MKKRFLSLLLCLSLLAGLLMLPVGAYTGHQLNTADALYQLGLFLGTGTTYDLDGNLTREQGITLLIRMLGLEEEAKNGKWTHPFTDVSSWADPYVGCAFYHKLTDGVSETKFGGELPMTDQMFLTLCLRALGYADKSAKPDFSYNDVWSFAKSLGLTSRTGLDDSFTRGEVVEMFWKLLNLPMKGSKQTLAESLIQKGVFTKQAWEKAKKIQTSGKASSDASGERDPEPTRPDKPDQPDQPDVPGGASPYETPDMDTP